MKYLNKFNEDIDPHFNTDEFIVDEESHTESDLSQSKMEDLCDELDAEILKPENQELDWEQILDIVSVFVQDNKLTLKNISDILDWAGDGGWSFDCIEFIEEYHFKMKRDEANNGNVDQELDTLLSNFVEKNIDSIYDNKIEKDGKFIFNGDKVIYSIIIEKGI